jgi:hypothetical protein
LDYKKNKKIFFFADIFDWIIFLIFTAIPFVVWVYGFGPKKECKLLYSYIDFSTNNLTEERECNFSFGHVFFLKKIELAKYSSTSTVDISCKPQAQPKRGLPSDCYELLSEGKYSKIYLKKNKFIDEKEINIIYIVETSPISENYKNNIHKNEFSDRIEVLNDNLHEVKQYPLILPSSITNANIHSIFGIIESWRTDITSNGEIGRLTIFIDIPAKKGTIPGRKTIPILE